jgi:tetratricopeptide (TPR) repeat protein
MNSFDDEEEPGRILGEEEFMRTLNGRDDIFLIDKGTRLRFIEMLCLLIGMGGFLWLESVPEKRVASDFYREYLENRMVKLALKQGLTITKPRGNEAVPKNQDSRWKTKTVLNKITVEMGPTRFKTIRNTPAISQSNRQARQENRGSGLEDANFVQEGIRLKKQENYAKAIENFKRVLVKTPYNFSALSGLADSYLYDGLLDSSAAQYKAAIAVNSRNAAVHSGLGSVYYFSAEAPSFTGETKAYKTSAAYAKSRYDSAMAEFTRAISLDSSVVEPLVNRGLIREKFKDKEGAIRDYTLAIKIKPSNADAYVKRAAAFESLGEFSRALEDFTAAISGDSGSYLFDPTLHFSNAYFGRANVYYKLGEFEKAIADYDSSLKLSPGNALAILNKARALGDENQFDSAIALFTKAQTLLSPNEYNGAREHAIFGRGLIYNETKQYDKALVDFSEAITMKPTDHYAYFQRGSAEKALKRFEDAINDYSIAFEYPKLSAKSCWRIAECYALEKDKANSLKWLKKAVLKGFIDFGAWKQDTELSILWDNQEFIGLIENK